MKLIRKGKSTRRISIPLPPSILPPPKGTYATSFGEVKISAYFQPMEGRWWMLVVLPPDSGFQVRDFLSQDERSSQ